MAARRRAERVSEQAQVDRPLQVTHPKLVRVQAIVRSTDRRLDRRLDEGLTPKPLTDLGGGPLDRLPHRQVRASHKLLAGLGRARGLPEQVPLKKVIDRPGDGHLGESLPFGGLGQVQGGLGLAPARVGFLPG